MRTHCSVQLSTIVKLKRGTEYQYMIYICFLKGHLLKDHMLFHTLMRKTVHVSHEIPVSNTILL